MRNNKTPHLAVILVGDNSASKIYIKAKQKACERAGIVSKVYYLAKQVAENELLDLINKLNKDKSVHAILVQFPLPEYINKNKIMNAIATEKDVDGFNPINLGRLLLGDETLAPCAPKAVIRILENADIGVVGKNVVIINNSNIVGKPLALMLSNRNATVDICNVKTRNLKEHTQRADIIITATGVPGLIKQDMVKQGVVIIDVGISRVQGRVVGDVDFENVKDKASFITPTPGGVGPMTVAMLMENTFVCYDILRNTEKDL